MPPPSRRPTGVDEISVAPYFNSVPGIAGPGRLGGQPRPADDAAVTLPIGRAPGPPGISIDTQDGFVLPHRQAIDATAYPRACRSSPTRAARSRSRPGDHRLRPRQRGPVRRHPPHTSGRFRRNWRCPGSSSATLQGLQDDGGSAAGRHELQRPRTAAARAPYGDARVAYGQHWIGTGASPLSAGRTTAGAAPIRRPVPPLPRPPAGRLHAHRGMLTRSAGQAGSPAGTTRRWPTGLTPSTTILPAHIPIRPARASSPTRSP